MHAEKNQEMEFLKFAVQKVKHPRAGGEKVVLDRTTIFLYVFC